MVKAVALGADLVGIGRLYRYGFAAAGIARVIELLQLKMAECLGLLGLTEFAGLCRSHLRAVEAVAEAVVLSAFPLPAQPSSGGDT